MKVLCPIDFSESSINACYWIADFLAQFEVSELHLCHFIQYNRRASMFLSVDELFIDRAEKDMKELTGELSARYENLEHRVTIYKSNPKEGIVRIAKSDDYDLIVTGTSGLNALKSMTIGSVTKYIFDHCSVPVLAIPTQVKFNGLSKIALAVDNELVSKTLPLLFLRDLINKTKADLHLVHVTDEVEAGPQYDLAMDVLFKKIDFVYDKLPIQESLADTLSNYTRDQNVDLLCMIHHPKDWFKRLFSTSVTTSELFTLSSPLLVLRD